MIRRGRAGERGFWWFALGWEGVKLAGLILIPATLVLVGAGAYGAAVYDQGHSRDPLASSSGGGSSAPSLSFVDFSPVGLHEDCILKVARESGLTWDGGLGWTAADPPRPSGTDRLSDAKVQGWRNAMSALLGRVSAEWHDRCEKPDLEKTPEASPSHEAEAPLDVNGTYNVETGSLSDCAVVEASVANPTTLTVQRSGDTVTLSFPGSSRRLKGDLTSDLTFKASYADPAGGGVDIDGRFTPGTGGDVLLRDGNVLVTGTGRGLVAHPCQVSFFARKPGQ